MKKCEYIEKMANLIASRVKFHAPILNDNSIDYQALELVGISPSLPIFKYEKPMTKLMYKAFKQAQEEVDFTLIASQQPLTKHADKLKNFYVFKEGDIGYSILSSINALNINYRSSTDFSHLLEENYIKVNDEIVNLNYREFYLHKKASTNGVVYEIKEFVLNGKNFILNFTNLYKEKRAVTFEINVVLPNGYYLFKRESGAIRIENLTNKDVGFFNFNNKNAKFSFSTISGLESSTHACVNMRLTVNLDSQEQKRFYFNFGRNKYNFTSPRLFEEFFELSQVKTREIFDVRLNSKDKNFDNELNKRLPQKIWLSWLDFKCDMQSEERYLKLKNLIIKFGDRWMQINENFKGIKEVQVYKNLGYKHIYVVSSPERFILADKTKYFGFTLIADEIFKKNNEIYLSFGT